MTDCFVGTLSPRVRNRGRIAAFPRAHITVEVCGSPSTGCVRVTESAVPSNNPDEAPAKEATTARKHLLQAFADYDAIAKRIRKIPSPTGPGGSQDRVQAAITTRATNFLQKNMIPLQVCAY